METLPNGTQQLSEQHEQYKITTNFAEMPLSLE